MTSRMKAARQAWWDSCEQDPADRRSVALAFAAGWAAAMSGWQPVQTAPQTGELVLLWAAARDDLRGFVTIGAYHPDGGWCVDELREVTHWQPLPAPPETTP